MSRLPLRLRLVAGFLVAMLILLTAAGAFVYWRVEYALDRGLDTELAQASTVITPLVGSSGQVSSAAAADATGAGWQVVSTTGVVLDSGGPAPAEQMVTVSDLSRVPEGQALTKDIGDFLPVADNPYRVRVSLVGSVRDVYLLVGVRRDHRDEALRELLLQLTLAGLGALAVAAVVGDRLARAALRPVERYRRRAEEIAGGADGLRLDVPPGRDDEVTRLGHTLNDMLAELERSLAHERRFVNDASHELRTPLTLLRSRIQLARRRTRTVAEHESALDELAIDVARLAELAEQLLAPGTTRASSGGACDVNQAVATMVKHRRLARPADAHDLVLETSANQATARVEPVALDRILTNLVENAFGHGIPPVRVRVRSAPGWVVVQIEDMGPGMTPDLLATATERFTRSPEARARPGAGLGLSLVEQMIDDARGELRLCHGGVHASHGNTAPVPCQHPDSMTTSVLLPASAPGPGVAGETSSRSERLTT